MKITEEIRRLSFNELVTQYQKRGYLKGMGEALELLAIQKFGQDREWRHAIRQIPSTDLVKSLLLQFSAVESADHLFSLIEACGKERDTEH